MKIRKNTFLLKIITISLSSLYGLLIFFIDVTVCNMPAKLDEFDMRLKLAIAQRFKNIRQDIGKTQQDLAHGYGRDKQSLSKNERGKGATIYTICKFCIENDMTLSEFFDSEEFEYLKPKKKK